MFRVIFKTVVSVSLLFQIAHAEKINTCQWHFSSFKERFEIINKVAERSFANKVRKSVKTKRGDIVAYDFIPGSLEKDPIVIEGGLWYKIQYFDLFNRLMTQQGLMKDVFAGAEKLMGSSIQDLVAEGHPVVIISRATQPESIAASLAEGVKPSFVRDSVTLDDHAQDAADVRAKAEKCALRQCQRTRVTKDELTQMLLVNKAAWDDGKKVVLCNFASGTDDGEEIFKRYMGMSGVQAKKHYLTKVFNGLLPAAPNAAETADEVMECVAKSPGAIGVIPRDAKFTKVKVTPIR